MDSIFGCVNSKFSLSTPGDGNVKSLIKALSILLANFSIPHQKITST